MQQVPHSLARSAFDCNAPSLTLLAIAVGLRRSGSASAQLSMVIGPTHLGSSHVFWRDFARQLLLVVLVEVLGCAVSAGAPAIDNLNAATERDVRSGEAYAPRADKFWDVRDFGAKCDNVADDEPAFAAALTAAATYYAAGGKRVTLHIAAGTCFLGSGTLPTFYIRSGTGGGALTILGDGPHQSTIRVGSRYSGAVISVSEAWNRASYVNPFSPRADFSGITLQGFSIVGDNSTSNKQDGIVFYDRNDFVSIRDVDVRFLSGRCLYVGATLNVDQAYMRESNIDNLHCWHTGPRNAATFEISSATTRTSDASNEINIHALNILGAAGAGFKISNPLNHSASRQIKIFGLRVESSGGDQIVIQDEGDAGTVANINFYGMESIGAPAGSTSFKINARNNPYNINVYGGYIYASAGAGIDIEGGSSITVQLGALATAQTSVKTGASINGPVVVSQVFSGNTFNLDSTTASWVTLGQAPVPMSLNGSAVAGRFYGPPLLDKPVNAAGSEVNRLYAIPVYISHPSLLKTLSFDIGTANMAMWHAEMCVYADSGKGAPGKLVPTSDSGSLMIAPGTAGLHTVTLNSGAGTQLIGPSWYWLAFEADSAAESLYSIAGAMAAADNLYSTTTLGSTSAEAIFNGLATSGVYTVRAFGSCPAEFGKPTLHVGAATPYIVMGY